MLSELAFPHIRCCLSAIPSDLMKPTAVDESLFFNESTVLFQRKSTSTNDLVSFKQAKLATKHKILSLIGKLHFVCRVCPPAKHSAQDDRDIQEGMLPASLHQAEHRVLSLYQMVADLPGMGSATSTMQNGPAAQIWSCLLMPATRALVVTFRVNGAEVPFPNKPSTTRR